MQQPLEHVVLLLIGQVAEEQQVRDLRKAEALLADVAVHQVGQVVAAVDQAAGHGYALAVLDGIAEDIADGRAADHDAGAVVVAQAALDVAVRPRLEIQVVMNAVIRA